MWCCVWDVVRVGVCGRAIPKIDDNSHFCGETISKLSHHNNGDLPHEICRFITVFLGSHHGAGDPSRKREFSPRTFGGHQKNHQNKEKLFLRVNDWISVQSVDVKNNCVFTRGSKVFALNEGARSTSHHEAQRKARTQVLVLQ